MRDAEKRKSYFEKLESLKTILEEEYIKDLVFENKYTLESEKTISRIWVEKLQVSVSNRAYWDEIFDFFNEKMDKLERFYLEYEDFIKDI